MVYIVLGVLALLLLIWAISGFSLIQEYQKGVVFILGHFKGVRGPGVIWLPKGISKIVVVDTHTVHLFIAIMKHFKTLVLHTLTAVKALRADRHRIHLLTKYRLQQDSQ